MEQRTNEWDQARLGNATASKINDIVAKTKDGKAAASRKNYAVRLALERLTGNKTVTFQNSEMLWGVEKEPLARAAAAIIDAFGKIVGAITPVLNFIMSKQ